MRLPGYKQGHQNTKEKRKKNIIKYMSSSDSYPLLTFWSFKVNCRSKEWSHVLPLQPGTAARTPLSTKTQQSFRSMLCPCKTCPHLAKGAWLARDQHRMHPDSSIFFPFHFLCDSWNVFAHGGKNAERREKQPGTSPSLLALSSGDGSLCQHW